ncbi:MAG TPA: HPF/RaiA family ribosome-associated protein, partial [Burkholderiaceae bacterium]|nr:HPF/RaiA family ribosome-associated protein [Burkholderiaceae bacterium]
MQVQVNTGHGIENKESLERWAAQYLDDALGHFRQDITRVEVQLSDENNGGKGAADKRCALEARLTFHQPLAVTHHAENQDLALRGAALKLQHLLEHTLGKLESRRGRDTIR